jgi:hypothetical protein
MHAVEKNYIPVIDMKNYKNCYSEKEAIDVLLFPSTNTIFHTFNVWEYYFLQPSTYTLDDVYKSKNVILCEMRYLVEKAPVFLETEEQIENFHKWIINYSPLNETTKKFIEDSRNDLFNGKKNILGVLYRGTDYVMLKPENHSIIASLDDYINKTDKYFKEWEMEWIYLETEDLKAVNLFKKYFGEKLLITNSARIENYSSEMGWIPFVKHNRKHDNYLNGLEYIRDTILLSECACLIGPKVNGVMVALAINNNRYAHKYIYDLGVYRASI